MGRIFINVAEKNSIAKDIAKFLSGGQFRKERSCSQFNPNFFFNYQLGDEEVQMKVTSVAGHIEDLEFEYQYKQWKAHDPVKLLTEAKVIRQIADDKRSVAKNIRE